MANPLISVIMSAHNYGRFIGEAIQSVLDQTYDHFELIVIDDASTDDTRQVIDAFSDDRIVPIHRAECTCSGDLARNDGLAIAHGDLIAIADADDVNLPGRFEKQVGFFERRPDIDLLGGAMIKIHANGIAMRGIVDKPVYDDPRQYRQAMLSGKHVINTPTLMFRQRILERVQGFRNYPSSADAEFLLRASRYYSMGNLVDVLILYRRHKRSVTRAYGTFLRERHHGIFIFQEFLWIQKEIEDLERVRERAI